MKIVEGIPPRGTYHEVALDLEMFGLEKLHRPHGGKFGCLTLCPDGKTVYLVTRPEDVEKALARVDRACWSFHYSSFDLRHLRRWADIPPRPANLRYHDTFLVEKVLFNNYYGAEWGGFSLADLARRHLNVYMEKETREEFYDIDGVLTDENISYAAKDCINTWKIAKLQRKLLQGDPQSDWIWSNVDGPAQWAVLDFKGFRLNVSAWTALAKENREQAEKVRTKCKRQYDFDPGSWMQVKKALAKAGIEVDGTGNEYLEPLDHPIAKWTLEFRYYDKRASAYGDKYLGDTENGYIYTDYAVTGALTGRMASSEPQLQNVPREKEYRRCFVASPGNRLVLADYSAQEPRILAYLSKDRSLIQAFVRGEDVHQNVANDIAKVVHRQPDRHLGKAINLASSYGMTAWGLAEKTGMSVPEAELMLKEYFSKHPWVKQYITQQRATGLTNGYVRTPLGRKCHINPYDRRSARNGPLNYPIQGGGADITKLAVVNQHKRYGSKIPIVEVTHDEIGLDVPKEKAKKYAKELETDMLSAFDTLAKGLLPGKVDVHIGRTWADK